jgi:glycosyltransferase involved in cell wall biosynthesis
MSSVGHRVARRLGVPHVHTEHGSAHVRGVSRVVGAASRIIDLTMGRAILRGADLVLGVSEPVMAFVQRLGGVPSVLFYNAIYLPAEPAPATGREARFVFVGRIVPGKGWDDLLGAAAIVRDRHPDLRFTVEILGAGHESARLAAEVQLHALSDIVTVHGQVAPEVVAARLRSAVLVNPTRLAEGFQTTLLEALAAGSQVVTYPVPGAELLREQGAPVRIAPRSTVDELADLMEQSLRSPMPGFPAAKLALWTWPERAHQYADLLTGLANRARHSVRT